MDTDSPMPYISDLRRKRLLLLATAPKWHKRFYSQYYWLIREGLILWILGYASLTRTGYEELKRLSGREYETYR